jgi:vancomycin resistance protein VanJ
MRYSRRVTLHDSHQQEGRVRRALRTAAIIAAVAYPAALILVVLALRGIGERWWVTVVAMYLPRAGFALPLPFVLAAQYVWGPRKLLAVQVLSVLLLLFPLMGLNLGLGRVFTWSKTPAIRIISFNVKYSRSSAEALAAQARDTGTDLVLLQDATGELYTALRKALGDWDVRLDAEFILATRLPVKSVFLAPPLVYPHASGEPHYVQYSIETAVGLVDVFNVHTTSPRPGLDELRGSGLREEMLSGRLFTGAARGPIEWNAYRRAREVAGIAARAAASPNPVIVAGDTNLPGLSRVLGEHLGRFHDAFEEVGVGFGYTYPATLPWMRIDRILTNDQLKATSFRAGLAARSDHLGVFAVLARAG